MHPSLGGASQREPSVSVRTIGGVHRARATLRIDAAPARVWEVLSDYERLDDFVPGITRSQVRGVAEDGSILVEQASRGRFLFLSRTVELVIAIREEPPSRVRFRQHEGPFSVYEGSWEIARDGGGSLVTFAISVRPDFFAPGFVVRGELKDRSKRSLEAVAREVAAARPAAPE